MGKTATLAVLLGLGLALPSPAAAAPRVVAPPGYSEADQYYQSLPGPTGPRAPVGKKEAREGTLDAATERALQRGATGQALAKAISRIAPPGVPGSHGSPPAAVLPASAVSIPEKQGLGLLFPLLLAALAAGAAGFAVVRRRKPGSR